MSPIVSGGGVTPSTATATVTTDANTFVNSHVFDLGRPTVVYLVGTLTAVVADGETFGPGMGQIGVDIFTFEQSYDGATFKPVTASTSDWFHDNPYLGGALSGFVFDLAVPVGRYIRPAPLRIIDSNSFNTYAGANHPTATVRFNLAYL